MQASDADKSITGRPSSSDVKILWKKKTRGHPFSQIIDKTSGPRCAPREKP
jgi:hypothetical protein